MIPYSIWPIPYSIFGGTRLFINCTSNRQYGIGNREYGITVLAVPKSLIKGVLGSGFWGHGVNSNYICLELAVLYWVRTDDILMRLYDIRFGCLKHLLQAIRTKSEIWNMELLC